MLRSSILLLLLAGAPAAAAGTDGYLRQGPPLALRFAQALIPPPPVNELILALGKPPVVAEPEVNGAPADSNLAGLSDRLRAVIQDLISKPAAASTGTTVDTAAPTVASEAPGPEEILPQTAFATEAPIDAGDIVGVMELFETNRRNRGQRNTAVIAAPAAFLPPQPQTPAPSSRAVYTSP